MYYVKQIKFDAGETSTIVLLSTKELAIAVGVCRKVAFSSIENSKLGSKVFNRVYDGNRVIVSFDSYINNDLM